MHDYRTEQIILAEGTVRTRRLKPPRPAVPSRAAGDKRSFVLLVAAVLLLSLIWVWSNLPVQGQLDHAAPGEMDTASSFEYGLSLLAFLIGWSAVAASIVIPAWLVRPYSNGERRSIRFVASCFLAWLTLGAVTLAGDVLLHAGSARAGLAGSE